MKDTIIQYADSILKGTTGIVATQVVHHTVINDIVNAVVSVVIGIVTLWSLIKKKKKENEG